MSECHIKAHREIHLEGAGGGGGGEGRVLPYGLCRYVRPQTVWFFSRFGHTLRSLVLCFKPSSG